MQSDTCLEKKVAIVTGSSRRMGRAIALRLAQSGASIVVNCRSAIELACETAAEIEAMGVEALPIAADVTDPNAVAQMVAQTVDRFGRIDILVNNVAIRHRTPLAKITYKEWRDVIASVLDAAFLCAQACAPYLAESEGTIINIGGASAHYGSRDHAHVMAAKAGLLGLTRSFALDLGPKVTANCLVPGRIDAPGDTHPVMVGPRMYTLDRIPMGRAGTLDEVTASVVMLCNPNMRFLTGQAVHLNGGMYYAG